LRGRKTEKIISNSNFKEKYIEISTQYLKTKKRPQNIEIQQTINAFLKDTEYGIGHLDDGLIYIGTNFCKNHETPKCENCPIKDICLGYKKQPELIKDYRT
jgi:adenine-specific DNA glycosylase